MKATELRIGNNYKDVDGSIYDVLTINANKICGQCHDTEEPYDMDLIDCKPIDLTEEWLIRFKANKLMDGLFQLKISPLAGLTFFGLKKISNYYQMEIYGINPETEEEEKHSIVTVNAINYVHQLQNLVFTLTGEELKITDE